jgi:outer membrane protein OmpA-like peptidoglycan-associated protein
MKIKIAILFFTFFTAFSGVSQYKNTKLKMADGLLEDGKIYAALEIYEDIVKKDQENRSLIKIIAKLHEQLFNYSEASKWYYELMEVDNGEFPKAEFKFAQLMKMTGQYDIAIKHYISFDKSYKGHDRTGLSKICKTEIKSCKKAMEALPNPDYSISKLSNLINSSYTDVAPFGYNGNLYYSTIPTDTSFTYTEFLDSAPSFQIYVAKQIEDDKFDSAKLFIPEILNTPFKHTANGAFNKKGDKFFFTKCKENVNGKMICKIYCTIKKDSVWQKAIKLNNEVNDANNDYTSTHPTIMSYKKGKRDKKETEILVYASTKPGGLGGYDIWSSVILNDLTCEKSTNLGKNVNSQLNEVTPFFDGKNKFYFSSNGKGGFGGFDVFEAPVKRGKIKKSKGMDLPINSSWDDWYYNQMNSNFGFLSSNRKSSRIYHNNIRLDDIYFIKKETKKYLILKAINNNNSLNRVIKGVVFKVKFTGDVKSKGKEVKANDHFQIIPNKSYEIIAQKNGFINQKKIFSTSYDTKSDTITWEFLLSKVDSTKEITLDNIYFDSNSSVLKTESKAALNRLFQTLSINPSFVVEIGAHTDNQGSETSNQALSENRAKSVVTYLEDLEIGINRLSSIGYGSKLPVSDNDTEENRKLNRRITFKIIGTTQKKIPNESK